MYERTCLFICARECGTHVYSTVPVRGLGMGCVLPTGRGELRVGCGGHVHYERTCVFICACECGTHVYSRPGYGLRTPYREGCTARIYTGACVLHFCVCTCGTVFGLGSASSVSCMCMCMCTAVGMCSPSVVPLVVSTCVRALYSIWHGGLGGVRSIHECYLHACIVLVPLEQCFGVVSTGDVPILPVLCLHVRTVLVTLHSVCTVLVPLVQCFGMASTGSVLILPMLVPLHSVYYACTPCTVFW